AVKDREMTLYGDGRNPPKIASVKAAWEKIAVIISEAGQHRTSGEEARPSLRPTRNSHQKTGGGSGSYQDLMPAENIATSTLAAESVLGALKSAPNPMYQLSNPKVLYTIETDPLSELIIQYPRVAYFGTSGPQRLRVKLNWALASNS
ncbi:unnamed protein product, partial [Gadus morhua 'NCC']